MLYLVAPIFFAQHVHAHEVRPAFLEITETQNQQFSVLWKQPVKSGKRLKIDPVFPEGCLKDNERVSRMGSVVIFRWDTQCRLLDGFIEVKGLERTVTDVYVRITLLDGSERSTLLRAENPVLDLSAEQGVSIGKYLWIGVEHIIFGYDHLLFVLGLMLVVQLRQLILTVTAFTVAHSISLALATLADVSLPAEPVEIVIALSIALVALEGLHKLNGRETLSIRYPFLIAFGFGLIHGFGFAGALADIGLPEGTEVLALLLFNVGVELGQIAFIAVLLAFVWVIKRLREKALVPIRWVSCYFVGVAGTYWAIERVVATVSF